MHAHTTTTSRLEAAAPPPAAGREAAGAAPAPAPAAEARLGTRRRSSHVFVAAVRRPPHTITFVPLNVHRSFCALNEVSFLAAQTVAEKLQKWKGTQKHENQMV